MNVRMILTSLGAGLVLVACSGSSGPIAGSSALDLRGGHAVDAGHGKACKPVDGGPSPCARGDDGGDDLADDEEGGDKEDLGDDGGAKGDAADKNDDASDKGDDAEVEQGDDAETDQGDDDGGHGKGGGPRDAGRGKPDH